jgi:hypothetical protein
MRTAVALLTLIVLAGCAPVEAVTRRNTAGQPAEYVAGYQDGCGSGYVASGHPYARAAKDVRRFLDDKLYAMGWNDGFATCKGNYDSIQRSY